MPPIILTSLEEVSSRTRLHLSQLTCSSKRSHETLTDYEADFMGVFILPHNII
jgi:hypothetical protein